MGRWSTGGCLGWGGGREEKGQKAVLVQVGSVEIGDVAAFQRVTRKLFPLHGQGGRGVAPTIKNAGFNSSQFNSSIL